MPLFPSIAGPIAAWVLIVCVLLVGVVDAWLAYTPDAVTVTSYLKDLSRAHPILPLAVGVVLGHIFW